MKIASRLTILFFLVAIVPTAVVGFLSYVIGKRIIVGETTQYLSSINVLKSRELERWIKGGKNSIEELAQRPLVRQNASDMAASHDTPDSSYRRAHREILENHLKPRLEYGIFSELFVMCFPQGHISASTDEKQDGKYRIDRKYFMEGKSRTYVEGSYYSPALEQPAMTVSTPIKGKDGDTVAVLAGRLALGELSEIMAQRSGRSRTLDTYLVNSFNFFVSEPRFGEDYILKKTVRTEGINAGLSGKDGIGFYNDYRGNPVIGAYKWLPEFRMCIITEIDQSEAFAPVIRLAWIAAGSVLSICIAAIFFSMFVAGRISRPLIQLAEGARKIGKGNLEFKVGTDSKDEIGELSRAFDQMTQELKKTTVSRDLFSQEKNLSDSVINSLPGVFYLFDENGRLSRWNKNFERVIEYSAEEILQINPLDLFSGEDKQLLAKKIQDVFVKGEESVEADFVSKSGRRIPYYFTGIRVDIDGRKFLVGVGIDITQRKLSEEALLSLSGRQEALLSAIPDIIMEVDANKVYTWANGPGSEFFGGDVIGREAAYYFEGEQNTYGLVKPLFNSHEDVIYLESWQRRKDGEKRLLAWWCRVLKDEHGNVTGALSTAHDITERKLAEEEIRRLNAELEQRVVDRTAQLEAANRELEAFSYSVSHDLRSPLQHITGFAELLNKRAGGMLDEKSGHYLKIIIDSTNGMGRLIDELLSFSRMGRAEMMKKKTYLGSLLNEILKEFQADKGERNIDWKIGPLPEVYGDKAMLRLVFINLISNAYKFTAKRDEAVIEIGSFSGETGEVCIFVKDNGAGFDMKYVDKLFGIFQRLHSTEEFEGTGIGLANVRRIIHRHGGRVWAEGEVEKGATFYFTLERHEAEGTRREM